MGVRVVGGVELSIWHTAILCRGGRASAGHRPGYLAEGCRGDWEEIEREACGSQW